MNNEKKAAVVILANVKIDYPSLFEKNNHPKYPKPEKERKYSSRFLLKKGKDDEKIKEILNVLENICKENKMPYFKDKYSIFQDMAIIADADESKEPFREYYKLCSQSIMMPHVTDRNNNIVTDKELISSGDIVHAQVKFVAVPKNKPTQIACYLDHVKHIKRGDPVFYSKPEEATEKFALLKDDVEDEVIEDQEADLF